MTLFFYLFYRLHLIPIKIPVGFYFFFVEINMLFLKFVCKFQRLEQPIIFIKKKVKEELECSFQTYYKDTVK